MLANRVRPPAPHRICLLRPSLGATRPAPHAPWRRLASGKSRPQNTSSHWLRNSLGLAVIGTAAFLGYTYVNEDFKGPWIESQTKIEKHVIDVNDLRAQFIQEKRSLKSPGVYTWGSNVYRVVDPGSKDTDIKTPRRLKYFDGQVLRDFKIDEKFGAAITENGDLVQWGKGYSETDFKPTKTLTGKNLTSITLSESRIIALSSDGRVYSLPISKEEQATGPKAREGSWVPFYGGNSTLSYRVLTPNLKLGEKISAISSGQEHAVLLTSSGRVFTVAASTEHYPQLGQLGIPGLTWSTRPKGPVDACHEVIALKGAKVTQIGSGDYHSLALVKDGRVFAWGDNSFGQLGVEFEPDLPFKDTPFVLSLNKLYRKNISSKATGIAAGGASSFFMVDATRVLGPDEQASSIRDLGSVTADTWSCGRGIWGTLGTGRWIHLQDSPSKVKDLSGLGEYDEKAKKMLPIRLRNISVGTTHVAAVMDNKTSLTSKTTEFLDKSNDFGLDALWWGGNEHFQLGTGKRTNLPRPSHIKAPSESAKKPEPEARLQIMPWHKGKIGTRTVSMEQRVECGRHVSAIYSAV
ncbi:hypothetical protein N7462_009552 [Penicillium macrosclerotiorum]|uniref:uncharacterized protein n=1 Tax=Penicillium macrosclerotiorum TaxID=303699 RepID=UPI0025486E49|nr:uncharacterized protein N7462_009552 [Penicillium macrosclerotiorum]KAJ5674113.1 hypothetical protein N7462_009552 [Penicillium macrosclerotiorum]